MAGMTWRTLVVEDDGTLLSTPSKMFGETGDGIAWFVHNESGVRVKLRIKDIKKKSSGAAFSPIDFFTDHVTVEDGGVGMIVGQITFLPPGSPVLAKYTIEVKSDLLNKDYDPDLEIERPPA
jgi:hypothetical protein